ncbi:hypothetical protein WOLCODRAFT_21370 [Wolfiporia cocos MD-104 SS10]|uniref:Uncharacterized protein n=1 Tax=Wolfiporia cocos (strain MD-104) TaxID=742152 RepID=A0A2H3JK33_WOLCO|nr:hypothetical protein WOLCODRAFT_21370 [Wolfiporia cocos MD-104 SS10]
MTKYNFNLNTTLGFGLIGLLFATLFHGFSVAQTAFYFRNYRDDMLGLRSFVALLRVLDTTKQGIMTAVSKRRYPYKYLRDSKVYQAFWTLLINDHMPSIGIAWGYNNYMRLMAAEFIFTTILVFVSQLFFVFSVWQVLPKTHSWLILVACWMALAFAAFGMGPAVSRGMWLSATWSTYLFSNRNFYLLVAQSCALLADDVILATTLCYVLHGYRNDFSIAAYWYVWINTVLATLNARRYLRRLRTAPNQATSAILTTYVAPSPIIESHDTETSTSQHAECNR